MSIFSARIWSDLALSSAILRCSSKLACISARVPAIASSSIWRRSKWAKYAVNQLSERMEDSARCA
eukprot:1014107-Pleurochrysis_carterae.AAC.1